MGFALLPPIENTQTSSKELGGVSADFLHRNGCAVCPLNKLPDVRNPSMQATGSKRPVVYFLGEAPGEQEDAKGKPFVGPDGKLLHSNIPDRWKDKVRFNNVVRTRPPDNRTPTPVEIECCRSSVVRDIEETKPRAIFGLGNTALLWAIDQTGINKWRGRKMPVKIGNHVCWFFPIMHPASILHKQAENEWAARDDEFVFGLDLRNAFAQVEKLPRPVVHTREDAEAEIEIIRGSEKGAAKRVVSFIRSLYKEEYIGLDYETNRKRPYYADAKFLSAALSGSKGTLAFALDHRESEWSDQDRETVYDELIRFLHEAPCRKVAHSLPFELEWSAFFFGKELAHQSEWEDTVSQAWVLDDRVQMSKPDAISLQFLCLQYFGIDIKNLSALDRKNLDDEPLDSVLKYNAVDSKYHRLLNVQQLKRLREDKLLGVYEHHLERTITAVLTQLRGVPVDPDVVEELDRRYAGEGGLIEKAEARLLATDAAKQFHKRYGRRFNPGASSKDGPAILAMLGLYSDKADEKAFLSLKDPVGKAVVDYRKLEKVHSTYIKPLFSPDIVFPDGMMHPIISTCQTRTARTSSEDPNIQNWPKRQGDRNEVRKQVRARPSHKIVAVDYAGIQARNVAMESLDKKLVQAFRSRYDIHSDWRNRIAELFPQWVPGGIKGMLADKDEAKDRRQLAKNQFVFPTFFGSSGKSVASGLGVPENIGWQLHEMFWREFPDIKKWHDRLHHNYERTGYVTGKSGYRRRAPVAHTEIINTPIQADEAIIVCDSWNRLSAYDDDYLQAILMIHDDLTFEIEETKLDHCLDIIITEMVTLPFDWANVVPIEVEVSIGDDWFKLEKIGAYESIKGSGYKELA